MVTKDQKYNTKIRQLSRVNTEWKKKYADLQEKYNRKWAESFTNETIINDLKEENKKLQEELDVWKYYYDTAHHNAHSLNDENKHLKEDLQDMKMKLQDYETKMKHLFKE